MELLRGIFLWKAHKKSTPALRKAESALLLSEKVIL